MAEPVATAGSDVVVCYCDADAGYCDVFLRGLDSLREEQMIASWQKWRVSSDDDAEPPANSSSQVMLVLLSPEFLATGFMQRDGVLARLKAPGDGRPSVISALVRPVELTHQTLNDSVAPPLDSSPLCDAEDLNGAVQQILARIRNAAVTRSAIESGAKGLERTIELPEQAPTPQPKASPQSARPSPSADAPERIGRYKIVSVLGQGAFGAVYLAQDEQLGRPVAIKTPHKRRLSRPSDIESYEREARMVAQLDHPGIVPVYDVGRTDDGQFYVVSKVIDGKDLSKRLAGGRPSLLESAKLVALIAEALHYAHQRDLVHRDIKPANILVGDSDGRPYVADFGLAIREEELGQGPTRAGTPAYMSPEQARGEGHRVDGRSDVFSLGVVLYELITGRLPFRQQNIEELLAQIAKSEARPPRQIEASIPRELERICLKAMSNRIKDRYTTAQDFAEDLWFFVNSGSAVQSSGMRSGVGSGTGSVRDLPSAGWEAASAAWTSSGHSDKARRSSTTGARDSTRSSARLPDGSRDGSSRQSGPMRSTATGAPRSTVVPPSEVRDESGRAKVVAKGLRAFDNHDADFFLELVPGPRDRDGLPDIIRFWKSRLEDVQGDQAFSVGVVYGPSGCGKSSLVKAGLLPQLSPDVYVVYLDATARDTESRLAQRIKNVCPDASPTAGLVELMAWIRRGRGIPGASKLVVVIDQFEQWLQAHETDRSGELLDALRQCDGIRVQCLLMVRVDFMMSIHRFMNDLETPIQEGANSAPVDLFDGLHAAKVLRLFGGSYGRLPEEPEPLDYAGQAFIDAAVAELGPEGKIVPVHLALFADMCKGRPWRPETLKQIGGARGVGETFLEETFESTTAPLAHRVHEKACRAVLKCLLPPVGSNIRGQAQSRLSLAEAAGLGADSPEFAAVLGILDRDTRLITPVERETPTEAAAPADGSPSVDNEARYQLTHDYLVPSLREWLSKKLRETRRGRAQLRLEEFSDAWNDRPTPSRLPGLVDWLSIRALTRPAQWTLPQRKMMKAAGRRVGIRSGVAAAAVLCLVAVGISVNRRLHAQRITGLVNSLATAKVASVPEIVAKLGPERRAAAPLLLTAYSHEGSSPQYRLNASLAALSLDAGGDETTHMVDQVYDTMLRATPYDLAAMLECAGPQSARIGERANKDFNQVAGPKKSILPLASLVVAIKPQAEWKPATSSAVAGQLITAPADEIGGWSRQLRPARAQLVASLDEMFQDAKRPLPQRAVAGDLLVSFAPDEGQERVVRLVDLLEHSTSPEQFNRTYQQLEPLAKLANPVLAARLAELGKMAPQLVDLEREELARRQMYLVAAQLRLGVADDAWLEFKHSPDPTVRSLLVEYAPSLGVDAGKVVARAKAETDAGALRALLLTLAAYDQGQLKSVDVADFGTSLDKWRRHEDAGVHAAAEWLAKQWVAKEVIGQPAPADARSEKDALAVKNDAATWYANGQGQEFVLFRGPVEFKMGSPTTDPNREGGPYETYELQHTGRIPRSFELASKEVTVREFLAAWSDLKNRKEFQDENGKPVDQFAYNSHVADDPNCPIHNVTWYLAAAYCNWLSRQEGIPEDQWCYGNDDAVGFQDGMKLPSNYLARTGYRLPTEAEWEYACRSDAGTSRFFGEAPTLLTAYAWFVQNDRHKTWPVASLKPNDAGLFDVYGNVGEWCIDQPRAYSDQPYDDVESSSLNVYAEELRAHRGGGIEYVPERVTSAARDRSDPDDAYFSLGFRVARTMPPGPNASEDRSVGIPAGAPSSAGRGQVALTTAP